MNIQAGYQDQNVDSLKRQKTKKNKVSPIGVLQDIKQPEVTPSSGMGLVESQVRAPNGGNYGIKSNNKGVLSMKTKKIAEHNQENIEFGVTSK